MADLLGINKSIEVVNKLIQESYPVLVSEIAKKVFDSGGSELGRSWGELDQYTIKRKESLISPTLRKSPDSKNIRSGRLYDFLTNPTNLDDESYINKLPNPPIYKYTTEPKIESENNYLDANALRPFDDFGKTQDDINYIESRLEKIIQDGKPPSISADSSGNVGGNIENSGGEDLDFNNNEEKLDTSFDFSLDSENIEGTDNYIPFINTKDTTNDDDRIKYDPNETYTFDPDRNEDLGDDEL